MKKLEAHYLFRKTPLPQDISREITSELEILNKLPTKELYLKEAYHLITTHYESGRINTFLKIYELLSTGAQDLWNRSGFVHCTNQNYLLSLLLVKGGRFKESDIRPKWTLISYFSPHQYLTVRVSDNTWVKVDCWARHYGIRYGDYAHGFNTTLFKSFVE
jgi:hypothetical protein